MQNFKKLFKKLIRRFGYDLVKSDIAHLPVEATDQDKLIGHLIAPFTMTSPERIWSVINSVKYVVSNNLPGDFVECGVWRGGSAMCIAYKLKQLGILDRKIWLYDTYTGMTPPSNKDIEAYTGRSANDLLNKTAKDDGDNVWCIASKEDVSKNIFSTGYPMDNVMFIEGDVLDTLNISIPGQISLLRLDTDWYESTRKELHVLYPLLVSGGVCIIDDYGYWRGSRIAVDEYLLENNINVLLHPIDETGRIFIKP